MQEVLIKYSLRFLQVFSCRGRCDRNYLKRFVQSFMKMLFLDRTWIKQRNAHSTESTRAKQRKNNDLPEALLSDWSYNSFRSDIFCSICICVLWASMPYIYTPWYASTTAVQWNLVISHRHQCHTVLHTATYLRNSFYPIHVSLIMALHMTICIKRSSESLTYRLGGTGQLMPKIGSNMLFWIIPAQSYHWLCDLYVYTPLSITTWMVHFVEKFQYW